MRSKLLILFFILIAPLFAGQLPQITAMDIKEDSVSLKLSKNLLSTPKQASLDISNINKKRFYFNIGAELAAKQKVFKTKLFDDIKIAQFDKQTARVVIVADKDSKFEYVEQKNSLEIRLANQPKHKEESVAEKIIKKAESLTPPDEPKSSEPKKEIKKDSFLNDEAVVSKEEPKSYFVAKKKTVVVDAGHGGKDSGALGASSTMEKDIVLKTALILREMLVKKGYKVYLTRDNDVFIELQERTRFANQKNADVFVSIHANAVDLKHSDGSKFHGIETYFLSPARSERAKRAAEKENGVGLMDAFSKETFLNFLNREKIVASNKLAIDVQRGMLGYARSKHPNTNDGGVKEAPFWVLVGAQMPAVLVEIGYLTHSEDLERLREDYYKALIAKGIMEGIENYFQNN